MTEEISNLKDRKDKVKNDILNLIKKEKLKRDKQNDKINEQIS
jgi:hypothetical protein